ncbi:hypothetical protein BBBOND_0311810 [Babesia bigemina]|uniref:Uncharacterized protein n=1 Tax=Babesia bigemina TaxID=5866 RepID=A0A061D9T1_BABBI|nr:hypothetical protein BBBOND_0311810 [Babesia bigemina]CDR97278.1 hypothetical protein BBBOND_0311810 [Babesia bigemina]|eukprot:XP_012769464.1 hypothetical protein BBBOND_0311810 [Babesia bigemina]
MAERTEEASGKNQCGCGKTECTHTAKYGVCCDRTCKVYKAGCPPGCEGCKVKCKAKGKCQCCTPRCGCEADCYEKGDGTCKGIGTCTRCNARCKQDNKCLCHFCSCGIHCNGVICSCCSWCDPENCSGKECNGFVIGRCKDKYPDTTGCRGHVKYDIYDKDGKYGALYNRDAENVIPCDRKPHPGKPCTGKNCNWLSGVRDVNGNCVIKCTYCGKLCGQDNFRRCCTIAIPLVITVLAFLIFRFMLPEKFHAIMTKIRATFASSPRHSARSFSNLVGDKIPQEMNTDRYPAVPPRAYAGLA